MSLYKELSKRRVFTTAAIYIPSAWLSVEIVIALLDRFDAPQWVGDVAWVLFILGFPVALLLSWLFDVTTDGVKRATPGTPLGIVVLLFSGLFLSTSAFISYQVFSGRISEISVAILPLKTSATDASAKPYGSGIADSLRASLQQIPIFRVPAHTSSEAVVHAGLDIPGIASKLDVEYIVEGTLEMVGQNLNVSLSLIDAGGSVRWSDRFQRASRDIFSLQNDLVRAVALELGLNKSNPDLQRNIRKPAPTQDMEAHRLYLKGKYAAIDEAQALEDLKAARERDPGYAAVYPAIAFRYATDCWEGDYRRAPICELAVNYANQGLQIDPAQGDAIATLALIHSLRYDFQKSQDAIDRFFRLSNHRVISASIPWAYMNLGRLQLAWDTAQEFYQNDPLNPFAVVTIAGWAFTLKNDDELTAFYDNLAQEVMGIPFLGAWPEYRMNRVGVQEAIHDMRIIMPMFGRPPELSDLVVPPVYDPSLREKAAEELDQWFERGDIRPNTYWTELIGLHRTEQAVDMAFELFDQGVLNHVMFWIRQNGRTEFRSHPRFIELLDHIGLSSYWSEVGWPEFCEPRENGYFCGLDHQVE